MLLPKARTCLWIVWASPPGGKQAGPVAPACPEDGEMMLSVITHGRELASCKEKMNVFPTQLNASEGFGKASGLHLWLWDGRRARL